MNKEILISPEFNSNHQPIRYESFIDSNSSYKRMSKDKYEEMEKELKRVAKEIKEDQEKNRIDCAKINIGIRAEENAFSPETEAKMKEIEDSFEIFEE